MIKTPLRRVASLRRTRFVGVRLRRKISCAGRCRTRPPALRMVNERRSIPDVAVVSVLAPGGDPPNRDNSDPAFSGKQSLLPGEPAPRRHPWPRFDSGSDKSPAQSERNCRRIQEPQGRVYPIARRVVSAGCLVIFNGRQFNANSLQIAAWRNSSKNHRLTDYLGGAGLDMSLG